ncbi:MAG: Fic family protein [Kiritimatiellae bacterium]|nr:Fic family protein [Kiritimatiellia bacterium]
MKTYIYQQGDWPKFRWDDQQLLEILGRVRYIQGKILGRMESLGFELRKEAVLETLTADVLKSSEIEGEILDQDQVRSSVARKLGMDIAGLIPSDRDVDGIVDMLVDATQNYGKPFTMARLYNWHCALFPMGRSGMYEIVTGNWRDDSRGPMQVVSGSIEKSRVHYQAPAAHLVPHEMKKYLDWVNNSQATDLVIKAGIAHLWFISIHPFEDGNGRIARAITDMLLAKADGVSQRFYSMSSQIRLDRKEYYEVLEKTQKGSLDITDWLYWFLSCLYKALEASNDILSKTIFKHEFWVRSSMLLNNERQKKMLNKLLDGCTGNMTTSKWAKITKCSPDTALRDIQDLISKDILRKNMSGGRSTSYELF